MKIFSTAGPHKRSAALNCAIINQLATPGLGSLLAGRFIAGTVQLLLAIIGFCFFLGWFIQITGKTYRLTMNLPEQPEHYPWMGWTGVLIFFVSWLLAWPTSISVLRAARKAEAEKPPRPAVPPKLTS